MKKIINDYTTDVILTPDEAKTICGLGNGSECCAFLTVGGDGFSCVRMTDMSAHIIGRLNRKTMNAKYEGGGIGCAWEDELNEN